MPAAFDSSLSRRAFLRGLAAASLATAACADDEIPLAQLIADARQFSTISERIDFISFALIGHRYQSHPLIGGPNRPEVFVVRDDRFDCVTYCETVLAAAKAGNFDEFGTVLRQIRYHGGQVAWRERNHFFADWCERNIENGICRAVSLGSPVEIDKTLNFPRVLGPRRFALEGIPSAALLANAQYLSPGDIIGFISGRATLDYFHTGFVAFGGKGELLLRHAAQSKRRVLDERMAGFIAANRVRYVTVLRPLNV